MHWTRMSALVAAAISCLAPLPAAADGAYFTAGEFVHLAETTHQQAVLVYTQDATTLILQTGYAGDGGSFSWVIPTAREVTSEDVTTADPELFTVLNLQTSPKLVTFLHGCGAAGCAADDSSTGSTPAVTVFDAFRVDNYDVTVLGADDAGDLARWLDDNGYHVPAGSGDVFDDYISRDYRFVAVRFEGAASTGGGGGSGEPPPDQARPLSIRFEGEVLQFPMLISSLSTLREVGVLLYTVGTTRYRVVNYDTVDMRIDGSFEEADFDAWYDRQLRKRLESAGPGAFAVEYANEVQYRLAYELEHLGVRQGEFFVTRLHGYLSPEVMDRDLQLEPVPGRERLEIRMVYGGEIQAAIVSVPWDLTVLAIIFLMALRRTRRRRGRS